MRVRLFLLSFFYVMGMTSCSSDDNNTDANDTVSILGEWNLTSINGNPDDVFCPKTLFITENTYTESEYFNENCDEMSSFTKNYTLSGNTFTILNDDIQDIDFEITTLTEDELTWETITLNSNQLIVYSYNRIED